jgi:preprotein translocase subunit SecE
MPTITQLLQALLFIVGMIMVLGIILWNLPA